MQFCVNPVTKEWSVAQPQLCEECANFEAKDGARYFLDLAAAKKLLKKM